MGIEKIIPLGNKSKQQLMEDKKMGLADLGNIINAVKGLNITDEQKAQIKEVVKQAGNNKDTIIAELKKRNINVSADQIDSVIALADKL